MVPSALAPLYAVHVADRFRYTAQLLERHGYDGLLIAAGNVLHPFRDDGDYPFKVNPYFKAWLPLLDRPGSYVWLASAASRPVLFYHQPEDIWHQINPLTDPAVLQAFDVEVITHPEAVADSLRRRGIAKGQALTTLGQAPAKGQARIAYVGQALDCPPLEVGHNPAALLAELDFQRAYKSDYEVACLRLATERAVAGHRAAAACFRQGGAEYDIHMAYLQASRQLESGLPYGNIIALNEHAAVLHYTQKLRQPPSQLRSFLIDAGAEAGGYAADISRTYAATDGLFAQLIQAMDQLQQATVQRIAPGLSYLELHRWTHTQLAELLRETGLISGTPDEAVAQQISRHFLPHGLGHLLGLQVHDRGGWMQSPDGTELPPPAEDPYLRLTRPIEVGQVFTIEPGLYFVPSLLAALRQLPAGRWVNWQMVESLVPYGGIRIEDNIYVAADGVHNLTREAGLGGRD